MTNTTPLSSKKSKKTWLVAVVAVILIAVIAVGLYVALNSLGGLFKGAGSSSGYAEKFSAYEKVNKKFTIGQTIQFGPLDITATHVSRAFTPSSEELAYLKQQMTKKSTADYYNRFGDIDAPGSQYVQVRLTAQFTQERGTDGVLFTEIDPFENAINAIELNGQSPLLYWVNNGVQPYYRPGDAVITLLKSGQPVELVYLYKIPNAAQGVVTATVTVFTKTSSIVGTEGMPRADITYSLELW